MTEFRNERGEIFWSTACEDPIKAINFSLDELDDPWDKLEFLVSWREGDIAPWPEFLEYINNGAN